MKNIIVYVVLRYPVELIGVYTSYKEAKNAISDYTIDNENEDEFYIDSDEITIY